MNPIIIIPTLDWDTPSLSVVRSRILHPLGIFWNLKREVKMHIRFTLGETS